MANKLYITATEPKSGKSAIVLGMMQLLLKDIGSVAFFRPIINAPVAPGERDHDINLMLTHFGLDIPYENTFAYTLSEARSLINDGQREILLDNILKKYKHLESKYEFVLCEGTDYTGKNSSFEFDLNADIAANIGCPVMVVANGEGKKADEIIESTRVTLDALIEKNLDVIACLINRTAVSAEETKLILTEICGQGDCTVNPLVACVLPEEAGLGKPTMADACKWLNGKILYGYGRMDTLVHDYLVAAMQVGNFLDYIQKGSVILTPGDRSDIILACLASRFSSAYEDIAGIILTGGLEMPLSVHRLIEGWTALPIPIFCVPDHTLKTIQILTNRYGRIEPGDTNKINMALGHFATYVDTQAITQRLIDMKSTRITPKMFEYTLLERAAKHRMRIVLPEGIDERILRAADILMRRNVAEIILLGDPQQIGNKITELGLELDATLIDPESYPKFDEYVATYLKAREHKGVNAEKARENMTDPTYFGTMMVHLGDADGMVSGALNTTAHTLRPSFEFVKTKPGASIVSSVFLMCLKDRVLVFGDCAVNPNPTADQLADIAISSAETARIFGIEPRVAMLSYSTGASGSGADVDVVKEATRIAQEKAPEILLEGPLQYDAAIDARVAKTKLPNSKVAGTATVFIFPDLNTGNNTYKAVQRAADAVAIGPVLQGLNKPVNDLSRGCTVPDIVNTVAITAIQAQADKGLA